MEEKLDKIIDKLEIIQLRIDKMEIQHQELLHKFNRHVDFIDETYEGLRNPIEGVKRWLGR